MTKSDQNFRFYYAQVGDHVSAWFGTDIQAAVAGRDLLSKHPEADEAVIIAARVKEWEIDQKSIFKQQNKEKAIAAATPAPPAKDLATLDKPAAPGATVAKTPAPEKPFVAKFGKWA